MIRHKASKTEQYLDVGVKLADNFGVNDDNLAEPANYGVMDPLKACCGKGGWYNFQQEGAMRACWDGGARASSQTRR